MDVFSPLTLPCGLCLKNRLLRAAAFSGETVPAAAETLGEAARGGCALVTLAYTSVSADGRTFPSQFVLSEASAPPDFRHRRGRARGGRALLRPADACGLLCQPRPAARGLPRPGRAVGGV